MTRDEIISRLGWLHFSHIDSSPDSVLSRIEKLVADVEAAEREACAAILEANASACSVGLANDLLLSNAAAIRARSAA